MNPLTPKNKYAEVAVPVSISTFVGKTFYYTIPEDLIPKVEIGKRVLVPFGKRQLTGYLVGFANKPTVEEEKIKDILDVIDHQPILNKELMTLTKWISDYYLCPWGEVIKTALPAGINLESSRYMKITAKGIEKLENKEGDRLSLKILQELVDTNNGELKINNLIKKLKNKNIYSKLNSLQESGLINIEFKKKSAKIKPQKKKIVKFTANQQNISPDEIKKKSLPQAKIIELLNIHQEAFLTEIKKKLNISSSPINSLIKKGIISIEERESWRDPYHNRSFEKSEPLTLFPQQKKAMNMIQQEIQSKKFTSILLHGVTGSGKTEIYLQNIAYVLSLGKQALILVPEISLTIQLVERFKSRFGNRIAVLHSMLSPGERFDEWRRIKEGKVDIVIGARSAIFAPFSRLGLIVVDEEHETTYKQDNMPRYNARDTAIMRAKLNNIVVILGSATPSVESFYNAKINKFQYIYLSRRVWNVPLPDIRIVDMKQEQKDKGGYCIFSRKLEEAIEKRLNNGEQVILFLNRRGFATFVHCRECGFTFKCPNCSVSLTYHQKDSNMRCHYCNFVTQTPDICPECKGLHVQYFGLGTQRIEDEIKRLFPTAKIARMDRDTTIKRNDYETILKKVKDKQIHILIGTQMIAKGHDFPDITLAGIIFADTSLNLPDFRATEHTFQLLTQVAGRTGRGKLPGEVIIQTYNPEHYCIVNTQKNDYSSFYKREISSRRQLDYPPFAKIINLRINSNSKTKALKTACQLTEKLTKLKLKRGKVVDILGAAMAPLSKIKGKYRYQIILKSGDFNKIHTLAQQGINLLKTSSSLDGVNVTIDVDPVNLL